PPLPAADDRDSQGHAANQPEAVVAQPLAYLFALFVFVEQFDRHLAVSCWRRHGMASSTGLRGGGPACGAWPAGTVHGPRARAAALPHSVIRKRGRGIRQRIP